MILDVDPNAKEQIKFTGNLDRVGDTYITLIFDEVKEIIFEFSKKTVRVLLRR